MRDGGERPVHESWRGVKFHYLGVCCCWFREESERVVPLLQAVKNRPFVLPTSASCIGIDSLEERRP